MLQHVDVVGLVIILIAIAVLARMTSYVVWPHHTRYLLQGDHIKEIPSRMMGIKKYCAIWEVIIVHLIFLGGS